MQNISQYARSADEVIRTAEQGFFASLSEETKGIVRFLMQSIFLVDHYVDGLKGSQKEHAAKNILGYLAGKENLALKGEVELINSLITLKNILDGTPKNQRLVFFSQIEKAFDSAKIMATTVNPQEFVEEREKEARNVTTMVLVLASELGVNKKFSEFLHEISMAGNLLDSIEDARDDNRRGEIAIKPIRIYFSLAKGVLKHTHRAVKIHPKKIVFIGIAISWVLRHIGLRPKASHQPSLPRFCHTQRKPNEESPVEPF